MSINQVTLLSALDDDGLGSAIESILFVASGPVTIAALASALEVPRERVKAALRRLHDTRHGGIRLQMNADQVQFVTSPESSEWVHRFLGAVRPPALSRAALETLAVVAYRQPVTRADIEAVRGVNSDRVIQTLLARNLVEERGHRETLGRPMQYGTGFGFLEYFGLSSLEELPPTDTASERAMDVSVLGMRREARPCD